MVAVQFKESPLVARLRSPMQFHGLGNMIYNNAADKEEEVQKALHVWKIAIDKVGNRAAEKGMERCRRICSCVLMFVGCVVLCSRSGK